MSNIVITGFAVFGLVSIVLLSLYYILKGLQKLQYDKTYAPESLPTWPPYQYMQEVGSVCPTGWLNAGLGASNDKIVCNSLKDFNYESNQISSTLFAPITNWGECIQKYRDNPADCPELQNRCDFLNSATYHDNGSRISWFGVSNLC